jgi:hypothetical protein
VPPATLWEALSRTEDYPRWWTWLRGFSGGALEEGRVTHCVVRAPLPYSLRFDVHVRSVDPGRSVDAHVTGDIAGPAALVVSSHPDGSSARLTWTVELCSPFLRRASVIGRPVMQWGHEWVVDTGVQAFRRHAIKPLVDRG